MRPKRAQAQVPRRWQFTEVDARLSSPLDRRGVHLFNSFWFRSVRWAQPAFGSVFLVEKPMASGD